MLIDTPMRWLTVPLAAGSLLLALVAVVGDLMIIRTHRDSRIVPALLILLGSTLAVFEVEALYAYSSMNGGIGIALREEHIWALILPLSGSLSVMVWSLYRLAALSPSGKSFYTWLQTYKLL